MYKSISELIFFLKDLFCGVIDAREIGLVTSIERIMEHIFMDALAHPTTDGDDDECRFPVVKNQLLPGLRSFCSALRGIVFFNLFGIALSMQN